MDARNVFAGLLTPNGLRAYGRSFCKVDQFEAAFAFWFQVPGRRRSFCKVDQFEAVHVVVCELDANRVDLSAKSISLRRRLSFPIAVFFPRRSFCKVDQFEAAGPAVPGSRVPASRTFCKVDQFEADDRPPASEIELCRSFCKVDQFEAVSAACRETFDLAVDLSAKSISLRRSVGLRGAPISVGSIFLQSRSV